MGCEGGHAVGLFACQTGCGAVDAGHIFLGVVVGLRNALCVERVGFYQVGPGLQIGAVDGLEHIGTGQGKHVVVALQPDRPVGEQIAPEVGLAEPLALQHGAHGTVQDDEFICVGKHDSGNDAVAVGVPHSGRRAFWET